MDFNALPRRDLQALCKRNGIRANMTNVAMAEALAALPAVDGIEEYVKVPVAVPAPVVKAVAADGQRQEKQGSPLPRGRRVTAKAVEANVGKGDVKEDEKLEPAKEDPPALVVGRRGPSRRSRPAPAVATPVVEPVGKAEEKQDGSNEEDQRSEENKEDAPAPVVGRRGASRRARPAPAAVSAGAGEGEKREIEGTQVPRGRRVPVKSSEPIRSDDCEEEEEDLKQKASTDDAPALGVGRRVTSRRAQPTPALAAPAASKVAVEEQTAPIPRGRNAKAKHTYEVKLNDDEGDEKQGMKPEEADVSALGVGRRGASRRACHAPAVKVTAEVITLDDSEEEEAKEDTKPEEKYDDAPAIGVGRRCANRRTPAPEEAPATRKQASTRKTEAEDVAVDTLPIRPTRQRKPTMKAVAAAKEKALPKATRRGAVKNTVSQEEQEKTQGTISDVEAVPEPVSNMGCDNPEDLKEAADPLNTVQMQEDEENSDMVVIDHEMIENTAQKQDDEENSVMKETPAQELLVMDQECMDYSALQERQEDVEKCPAILTSQEDSPILGLVSMADEEATEKDEGDNFKDEYGSSEGLVDKRVFEEIHDAGEELEFVPIIQAVVTSDANLESEMVNFSEVHDTEETSEDNTEADLVSQEKEDIYIDQLQDELADGSVHVDFSGKVNLFAKKETSDVNTEVDCSCQEKGDVDAGEELEFVPIIQAAVTSDANLESEMVNFSEVPVLAYDTEETSEDNTEADLVSQEKEDIYIDQLQAELADCSVHVACSGNVNLFAKEETRDVNTEDGFSCQEKGNVDAGEELEFVPIIQAAVTSDANLESEMVNFSEVPVLAYDTEETSEDNTEADLVSQEKEDIYIDQLQAELADCSVHVACSGNVNLFAKEETRDVNTEDGFSCQEKGNVDSDMTLPDTVAEAIPFVCSSAISWVQMEKAGDITCEMPESSVALDEDAVGDLVETDAVYADELKDAVGDLVETDAVHADELEKVVAIDEGEDTAGVITEETNNTSVMDECVQNIDFEFGFILADELNNAVTADSVPEVTGANGNTKKTFTCDFQQELVTEYLSKSITNVEPRVSLSGGTSVCNNSGEKKAAEPVAILKEKGVKGAKKSVDLSKLSLGQLRTKLKETLNAKKNKEAKRVALARVDENVCRSHAKGQQETLNLQQH